MNNEKISTNHAISLIIVFLGGNAYLGAMGIGAKESIWLALIIATIIMTIICCIYSYFFKSYPNMNLFDIIETCFGTFIGKIIMIFLTYYFYDEGHLVLINFTEFVHYSILVNTPMFVLSLSMITLCVYASKKGILLLGQFSISIVLILIILMLFSLLILTPYMHINNMRPFISKNGFSILKDGFNTSTWPFGEILAFTMAFSGFKSENDTYKIYITGLLIGAILIFLVSCANVLVLGVDNTSKLYHPTYLTMKRINPHIEILPISFYAFGTFVKLSIYIIAACKGLIKIFNLDDYKFLLTPYGIIMSIMTCYDFDNIMDFWDYSDNIWIYYAITYEIIIPILTFIILKIKQISPKKLPDK